MWTKAIRINDPIKELPGNGNGHQVNWNNSAQSGNNTAHQNGGWKCVTGSEQLQAAEQVLFPIFLELTLRSGKILSVFFSVSA